MLQDFPKPYYNIEDDKLHNLVHHLKLKGGDVGRYVIMPGDPKRAYAISKRFENAKLVSDFREYATYTGYLDGVKVSATSHGIGGPSTAIALEELIKVGADTFIRVGTCGGMDIDVVAGDVVIVSGAIRADGTPDNYLPKEFPAVANFEVLNAMIQASTILKEQNNNSKFHIGVVHCKDAFYAQHAPNTMAVSSELSEKWEAYIRSGALASEMESATMFSVAAAKGVRAGAAMLVLANQERVKRGMEERVPPTTETAIDLSIEALKVLIKKDKEK